MAILPFLISPEAAAWIVEKVQWAEQESAFPGFVPTLYFCFNYQKIDEAGRVFEWCPDPFFDIGWYRPETAASHGFVELEILGRTVFAPPDTLERLKDKHMVLERVEVGFPTPADKQVQLLRVAPMAP